MNEYTVSKQLRAVYPRLRPGPYPDVTDYDYWRQRPMLHYSDYRIDHPDPERVEVLEKAAADWELLSGQQEFPGRHHPMRKYKLARRNKRHEDLAESIENELSSMAIFAPYDANQDYREHAYIRCGMSYERLTTGEALARSSEIVSIYEKYQEHFVGLTIELKETYARCFIEWKP